MQRRDRRGRVDVPDQRLGAEGRRDGKLVRGTEQKFHAQGETVDQIVPVPPKDVGRFGSGVQSEPK